MTTGESIIQGILTALAGTTGVSGRIFRSRYEALSAEEHPAILIEPVSISSQRSTTNRLSHDMTLNAIIMVRADNPDADADPIISDAHSRIMTAQSLPGVVDFLPVSTDWKFVNADVPLAIITLNYKTTYQTKENDLTSI